MYLYSKEILYLKDDLFLPICQLRYLSSLTMIGITSKLNNLLQLFKTRCKALFWTGINPLTAK